MNPLGCQKVWDLSGVLMWQHAFSVSGVTLAANREPNPNGKTHSWCVSLRELVGESKARIIKELETIPIIINEHTFMEGAAPFAIASAGALDLNIPFDALYALKDEPEKLRSTFFERLSLHLESVAPDKVVSIPY